MRTPINENELNARIELNYSHLSDDPYYQIGDVFSPITYAWYGDKEGRALLAFVSHYKISGQKIDCMAQMLEKMPAMLNEKGYLGVVMADVIYEQQLSGHSWLLRGLCEHYEVFHDVFSLKAMNKIVENLYLPTAGKYHTYPIDRDKADRGGVSGTELGNVGGWRLSTDVGCAFMAIDGLSHVYKITRDARVKALLDEMIGVYLSIDKRALRAQTHCTLSAARGVMRMYALTKENVYLEGAEHVWQLYVYGGGMTYTYQNLNWWDRPKTWTEPCAIVDSLMLSTELYKATGKEEYRTVAARIYQNGFALLERSNGGAGTDSVVFAGGADSLFIKSWEARFCCTMRLAEGLWYIRENRDLLYVETAGMVTRNEHGVYMDGDVIYAEPSEELLPYAENPVRIDGRTLYPLVKYYKLPYDTAMKGRQRIVF